MTVILDPRARCEFLVELSWVVHVLQCDTVESLKGEAIWGLNLLGIHHNRLHRCHCWPAQRIW